MCVFMYIYVYVCGKEDGKTEKKTFLLAHGQWADGMSITISTETTAASYTADTFILLQILFSQ